MTKYEFECTNCGFGGRSRELPMSKGYKIGQYIPLDATHPDYARCPWCGRNELKVTFIQNTLTAAQIRIAQATEDLVFFSKMPSMPELSFPFFERP